MQSLVAKCGKYSLSKFANFVYFCIPCENCYHFRPKCGSNFRTQYKSIQNSHGYIFRILQHFATKHCNFTHFSMPLFPGIYFFAKIKNYNGNCLFNYLKNASKTWTFRAKALHVLLVFFKQFKPSQCAAFWCYCPYLCWDRPTLRNSGQSLPLVVIKTSYDHY